MVSPVRIRVPPLTFHPQFILFCFDANQMNDEPAHTRDGQMSPTQNLEIAAIAAVDR
jgi:hypothetical protein